NDLVRVAADLEALVRGLTDDALARPAADLGPDHELGPDPGDPPEVAAPAAAVVARWRRIERRRLDRERLHQRQEPFPGRTREPRSRPPRDPQLVALVGPASYRAEVAGVALARRPAADHELLLRADLQLQPGRRPAPRLVARSAELRDDALEALLAS